MIERKKTGRGLRGGGYIRGGKKKFGVSRDSFDHVPQVARQEKKLGWL